MRAPGPERSGWTVHAPLMAVLIATLLLGFAGSSLGRPLFVLGAIGAAWLARSAGPARHVECAIILFAVAPLLRRVVDYGAGYDQMGIMLTAPLLAISIPAAESMATIGRDSREIPFLVAGLCVAYGIALSAAQGDVLAALANGLKWTAPLLYGIWLLERAGRDASVVPSAARMFLIVTPFMGAYGIAQYVDPQPWDRYWMLSSEMWTIGLPEPFKVRVFSTMNSPASFATFSATGLLLFGFGRRGWLTILLSLPVSIGLLLSLYRTAWVALAAGVLFCGLFRLTRSRTTAISLGVLGAVVLASAIGPLQTPIRDRLETFTLALNDPSGQERLTEFDEIYARADNLLIGNGMGALSQVTPTSMPIDGMLVASWLSMGLVGGTVYLIAIVWAAVQALLRIRASATQLGVVLGACIVGALVQIPLASITSGELGFLFWLVVAAATAGPPTGVTRALGTSLTAAG